MFLGYSDEHKGFLCYGPKDRLLHVSQNVVFLEHIPFYSLHPEQHPHQVSYLPHFPTSNSPSITKVYVRHPKPIPPTAAAPAPDHLRLPDPSSGNASTNPPPLQRSSRKHLPPNKFGFSTFPFDFRSYFRSHFIFIGLMYTTLARCQ